MRTDGLKVSGLSRRIADFEIRADFLVGAGERVALTGRSGIGKTSLLRMIAGLDSAQGSVMLNGREISGLPPEKRQIGYVFQEPSLFPALRVWENASYALRIRGCSREQCRALASEWLTRVGLGQRMDSPVGQLSGGEKQRLALVRATIWNPAAMLLDEPFSALDVVLRKELGAVLVELHERIRCPLILVTHSDADILTLAQARIGVREQANVRHFERVLN